jgi:hypothetical protein
VNGNAAGAGWLPDGFLESEYGPASTAGLINSGGVQSEFYRLDSSCSGAQMPSSGLLYNRDPNNLANTTFIVVNGLSPAGTVGANYIANWSFVTLIESFFWGGVYSDGGTAPNSTRITQLPQVVITNPNAQTDISNPSSPLPIQWQENWSRWDGRRYTPQYASNFSECTNCSGVLTSYVLYSVDGISWKYIQNDADATPGVRPIQRNTPPTTADTNLENAVAIDGASTNTTWDITDSAKFPQGTYIIRVETYRTNIPLHYSFHQYRIFINRG